MSKHTPGPWKAHKRSVGSKTRQIALMSIGDEECAANARLIAAAPELVETIRDLLNGLYALRDHAQSEGCEGQVEQKLIDLGIKAIAKAEGKE